MIKTENEKYEPRLWWVKFRRDRLQIYNGIWRLYGMESWGFYKNRETGISRWVYLDRCIEAGLSRRVYRDTRESTRMYRGGFI